MSNWGLRRTGVLEETTPHVFKDMLYFVYTDDVPAGWHGTAIKRPRPSLLMGFLAAVPHAELSPVGMCNRKWSLLRT